MNVDEQWLQDRDKKWAEEYADKVNRTFHKRYHKFWADIWTSVHWYSRAAGHLQAWMQDDYTDEGFDVNQTNRYPLCWRLERRGKRNRVWLEKEGYYDADF